MISVIVPIYNVEEYLPASIESILNQTYKDLEILLIDDGSTDNSGKICDEYAKQDNRCIVIHQANKGLSEARNIGLDHATGEYISFIDGDDYIHPKMLETLYEALQKGSYDFAMALYKEIYTKEKVPQFIPNSNLYYNFQELDQCQLMRSLYNVSNRRNNYPAANFHVVWNKLYKKSIIKSNRFINTTSEDTIFNNSIYLTCQKAIIVKQSLYYWVQRTSSITHQPVNAYFIDRAYSYSINLHKIPLENTLYRSFCLERLYKTIINVRYLSYKTPWHNYAIRQSQELKQQTIKEFIKNKNISLLKKLGLALFIYCPMTYRFFMTLSNLRSHFKIQSQTNNS